VPDVTALKRLLLDATGMGLRQGVAQVEIEILHIFHHIGRYAGGVRQLHVDEVRAGDILKQDGGSKIRFFESDLHIAHANILDVANEEAVSGHGTEAVGLRVSGFEFGRLNGGVLLRAAALVKDKDIAEAEVFDRVAGNAGDDRGLARGTVGDDNVSNFDATQLADGRAFRGAQAAAETNEKGDIYEITHGDIGDSDVFKEAAIHRFEGDAVTGFNHAIGDGDVAKAAVGFGAEFDAAGAGGLVSGPDEFESGVEERALLVAAGDVAIGDRDLIGGAGIAEAERTFEADAVIPGRIDAAIGDANVAAAVHINAVAVGVNLQVVESEIVHAGGQNGEVAAMQDGEIAQGDVVAIFQADGFIADAGGERRVAGAAAETFAPDQSVAQDGKIVDVFAPDEAVVPVAVAEVLISIPGIGLGGIVAAGAGSWGIGGEDGRARTEKKIHVAAQVDGETEIRTARKDDRASAGSRRGVNRPVNGGSVGRFTVAFGSEGFHVELSGGGRGGFGGRGKGRCADGCAGEPHSAKAEKFPAWRVCL